jgi:hypothetical protein
MVWTAVAVRFALMRTPLLPLIFLHASFAIVAADPEAPYSLGYEPDSPNKEYRLVLATVDKSGVDTLTYELVKVSTREILWETPSTYQSDGQDDSWALQNAKGAEVSWNKDSTRFALDEENHQFMGKVILGVLSAANGVTTHTIIPSDLKLSRPIEQARIRVDEGWISPTTLSLEISGAYKSSPRTHCKSLLRQIQAQARWSRASYMKA